MAMADAWRRVTRSPRQRDLALRWGIRASTLVALATVWELGGANADSLLIPTFSGTMAALFELVTTGSFWQAVWLSNQALVLGYLLSVVVGLTLGLAMARSRAVERFVDPYLDIALVIPMAALIPLFVSALGFGLATRVATVFAFAFVMVTVNTRAGVRQVDRNLVDMARSLGANELQVWTKVLLPGGLPGIVTGLRLALGRGLMGMVIVELLLIAVGIGQLVMNFQADFDAESLWAVILVVVAEAILLMWLLRLGERRLVPWSARRTVVY